MLQIEFIVMNYVEAEWFIFQTFIWEAYRLPFGFLACDL